MSKQIKQNKSSATDEPERAARPVTGEEAAATVASDAVVGDDADEVAAEAPRVVIAEEDQAPRVEAESVPEAPRHQVEHYWKPTLDASVEIGWADLGGGEFFVQLYFSNARMLTMRARAGAEGGQQLLVSTVMNRDNREVVVGVRTPDSPQNFLTGTFELREVKGLWQLWITRLRYPGGFVPEHQFN